MITSHQQRAMALALSQKGIRETPPGSNIQKYSAVLRVWRAILVR